MSLRTVKKPIEIPKGVEVKLAAGLLSIKGPKDTLSLNIGNDIDVDVIDGQIFVKAPANDNRKALTGTTCAHIKNMLTGVTSGFEKKLEMVGVGYKAQMKGTGVQLSLGYSHPVVFDPPKGVTIEVPVPTEIIIKGADRQKVGQAAAKIRAFRSPEPYKGKGVKYAGEIIIRKETKKK